MEQFGFEILSMILVLSGRSGAVAVCRLWRNVVTTPDTLASILLHKHGRFDALKKAVSRRLPISIHLPSIDRDELLEVILYTPAAYGWNTYDDHDYETAMYIAANNGFTNALRIVFEYARIHMDKHLLGMSLLRSLETAGAYGRMDMLSLLKDCIDTHFGSQDESYRMITCIQSTSCAAATKGDVAVLEFILQWKQQQRWAPDNACLTLHHAADSGQTEIVKMLSIWFRHFDSTIETRLSAGDALMKAATIGDLDMVRLLLDWPKYDSILLYYGNRAFESAAENNHVHVMETLLKCSRHAPAANGHNCKAFVLAAANGHVDAVTMLLNWTTDGPRADCNGGQALIEAAKHGHVNIMTLLLCWHTHAPRANCSNCEALIVAARWGQSDAVELLLNWKEHAPRADCNNGK
jgi:hypothetical protein